MSWEWDEHGDIIAESSDGYGSEFDFAQVMLDNLSTSGVQQAHRDDRIEFSSITPWPRAAGVCRRALQ